MRRRAALVTLATIGLLAWNAGSAGAQQEAPDTITTAADSARLAILERLERLARGPGADSLLYVQDSVRLAEAQSGSRPGAGMDSVATVLMALPGYSLTEYEGASADVRAGERVLTLYAPEGGRARVEQDGGGVFEADTAITYDELTGTIRHVGDGTYTPVGGDPVNAANMIYDLMQQRGTATGAETSFVQDGANWIVRGDMPYAAQDSTFMAHAQFTSCEVDEPHYHFQTDDIKIVGGNILVARGVTLYFADVPVAWLPFMAQSLARGRSSGLLTPRFSVNDIVRTSGGYRRRVSNVGFYWAMSDYSDALVSMDWFSETFFGLTGSLRYRFNRQFLDGDINLRQFWREGGGTELAIDTRHQWELDERTQLQISGRFADNSFVRENSFNPQEVIQSIDSEAGINRRFDWGSLSLSANRKQFLSDDRTEWLLPSANLSLSPITLLGAPSSEASFYNNMTWSGSAGFRRNTFDRSQGEVFELAQADAATSAASASSNLSIGRLTFSQSVNLDERETLGVPEALLVLGDSADPTQLLTNAPARDIAEATLQWRAGFSYQQQLIGSTTLTPNLNVQGRMFRSDTDSLAQSFVSAPNRVSFGATLKTDIYGFFGGVGDFEAIRHKISPAINYRWSPESAPSELQSTVFGSRVLQPQNTIELSLTQTFEAKRRTDEGGAELGTFDSAAQPGADSIGAAQGLGAAQGPGAGQDLGPDSGPRRLQQAPSVTLLAWRTSAVRYDFVEADSVGSFLSGFETVRLNNQFSSDFLRGMSISMDHELFDDELGENGRLARRRFSPHLSQVNLGFSLGSSSSIFRWLGLAGGDDAPPEEPDAAAEDLPLTSGLEETAIVPVAGRDREPQQAQSRTGSRGGWTASMTYSLQRPRDPTALASQMLSGSIRLKPTANWSMSWRTAYDLERDAFNDHSIRLTRDLHRWEANFDFLQTATGNWTFRFEVSLRDNRDLKFDYKQRNLDLGLPSSRR